MVKPRPNWFGSIEVKRSAAVMMHIAIVEDFVSGSGASDRFNTEEFRGTWRNGWILPVMRAASPF